MWVYWKGPVFNQTLLHAVHLEDNSSGYLKGRWLPGARSSRGSPGLSQDRAGTGSWSPYHCSSQGAGQPQQRALGTGHLYRDETRPGWDVSPQLGLRIWLNTLVNSNTCSLPLYAGNMHNPSRWIERSELMPLTPCWKVCEFLLPDVLSFAYWNIKLRLV